MRNSFFYNFIVLKFYKYTNEVMTVSLGYLRFCFTHKDTPVFNWYFIIFSHQKIDTTRNTFVWKLECYFIFLATLSSWFLTDIYVAFAVTNFACSVFWVGKIWQRAASICVGFKFTQTYLTIKSLTKVMLFLWD